MSTILRFTENGETKVVTARELAKQATYSVGTLLYSDSKHLPVSLAKNVLFFTTDTRELYVGTGNGLKRVNLGSDGQVIDKTDYLTKEEAVQLYVQKEYVDPNNLVTKINMEKAISLLEQMIENLETDSDYKADLDDVYTKLEADRKFVDENGLIKALDKKTDIEVLTNTGNYSYVQNVSAGPILRFRNVANNTESYMNIGKDLIKLYMKKTTGNKLGAKLYITDDGAFYVFGDDDTYEANDEILTKKDLADVQLDISELYTRCIAAEESARRSMESARDSQEMVRRSAELANTAAEAVQQAISTATEAQGLAQGVRNELDQAKLDSSNAASQAQTAGQSSTYATERANDALQQLATIKETFSAEILRLQRLIEFYHGASDVPGDDPDIPDPSAIRKIVDVEDFELKQVPYASTVEQLELPATVEVTLDDSTTAMVSVEWHTVDYNPTATGHDQYMMGELQETARITNPNYQFAIYKVRVLNRGESPSGNPSPVNPSFKLVFATSDSVTYRRIPNFSTLINLPTLQDTDLMGDLDSNGQYVEPTMELRFIGTLREKFNSNDAAIRILSDGDQVMQMNQGLLENTAEGLRVPIYGVSEQRDIEKYETDAMTKGGMVTQGAFSYDGTTDILEFQGSTVAPCVYLLRYIR